MCDVCVVLPSCSAPPVLTDVPTNVNRCPLSPGQRCFKALYSGGLPVGVKTSCCCVLFQWGVSGKFHPSSDLTFPEKHVDVSESALCTSLGGARLRRLLGRSTDLVTEGLAPPPLTG